MSRMLGMRGVILAALSLAGCAGGGSNEDARGNPYRTPSEANRDSLMAQRLTQEAARLIDKEPAQAEKLLRDALTADLYHGPAHNNLGVLYLTQDPPLLYEAASEFEWARKLMPGHPDPRLNLALALERAGRTNDALNAYETALEVYPHYLPAMQGIASLQLRGGLHKTDERTPRYLAEIAMRSDEPEWRAWARKQLLELESASPR